MDLRHPVLTAEGTPRVCQDDPVRIVYRKNFRDVYTERKSGNKESAGFESTDF